MISCPEGAEWRVCPSFPNYEVSEYGHVRRFRVGPKGHFYPGLLKPRLNHQYDQYGLMKDGKDYKVYAHRLVAEAFIGPKPFEGAQVCHDDGSRDNNHYSNLRWDTASGNQSDRLLHGTDWRGEKHRRAKLTDDKVVEIRRRVASGEPHRAVAKSFGVAQSVVTNVANRVRWTHVA